VLTSQVAPTILQALDIEPDTLKSVVVRAHAGVAWSVRPNILCGSLPNRSVEQTRQHRRVLDHHRLQCVGLDVERLQDGWRDLRGEHLGFNGAARKRGLETISPTLTSPKLIPPCSAFLRLDLV